MTATLSFTCTTIDAADPPTLAQFYSRLLGWQIYHSDADYAMVGDGHTTLCFGAVAGHTPPRWPDDPGHPKRVHFDLAVDDLAAATARAVELGATLPDFQPGADPDWAGHQPWTIVLDPEGTPICLNIAAPQ
ncbi:VOC family protein [Nocardia arthritidis]|uniref:VOC family protein n=1 Tax=Nocardia arthritidis TaxID=228602 RepID=A0A6G9YAK6_9NOCA|nr:VOC family protein [Nocardia arthritidis]QIS10096.1 VOC family protein [Nocardia arthritidis]